jgi:hypothetical protein
MNLRTPIYEMQFATLAEPRHNTRILVIDDDYFRDRGQEVLNRAGYLTMGAPTVRKRSYSSPWMLSILS